jgi:hypothetical protein
MISANTAWRIAVNREAAEKLPRLHDPDDGRQMQLF